MNSPRSKLQTQGVHMSESKHKLDAKRVWKIFEECLAKSCEPATLGTSAQGIAKEPVVFNSARLAAHKAEICGMFDELPANFTKNGGGGWSFLNACMDKHGRHWAEQITVAQLLALGIAVGKAEFLMPSRDMWKIMPGGMPYFVVN
jgi:hypothetical protein